MDDQADEEAGALDPEVLAALRALVDGTRLRIVARLAARPADAGTLAGELRMPVPAVQRNVDTLLAAGLLERREERGVTYRARLDRIGELGRALADLERRVTAGEGAPAASGAAAGSALAALGHGAWPHDGEPLEATLERMAATPDDVRTLRAYLVNGRLTTIPAQEKKLLVVLRFLLERVFTEDRDYPEKEVNQRLALFHPDVASLRRYLVDHGYADREAGRYRRRRS
jgi:DNA-binding MarR family transcriptional regulator